MSNGHYILVDGEPRQVDDIQVWARWYEDHHDDRRIAWTEIAPGLQISTVFLSLDHSFSDNGPPILFETMVFGGDFADQECERYSTIVEARAGHAAMVSKIVKSINKESD